MAAYGLYDPNRLPGPSKGGLRLRNEPMRPRDRRRYVIFVVSSVLTAGAIATVIILLTG